MLQKVVLAACLLFSLVVLPTSTALTLKRSDLDMMGEIVEIPQPAVDDRIAGTPGSDTEIVPLNLGRAHADSDEQPAAACDMSGNLVNTNGDEEPVVIASAAPSPSSPPVPSPLFNLIFPGNMTEFACPVTDNWPSLDPIPYDLFNLYHAQFEGNNRAGAAEAADYEVTNCKCMCMDNPSCGVDFSLSYYSDVPSPQACAQMICHKNKYSKCIWNDYVVANGLWRLDFVRFNTTALQANIQDEGTGLLDNFPSPSPSVSPMHQEPTLDELVLMRAMAMLNYVRQKTCTQVADGLLGTVFESLKKIKMADPPSITCDVSSVVPSDLGSTEVINELIGTNDLVANALAGYSGLSAVNDGTAVHALRSMNSQLYGSSLLVQITGDEDRSDEKLDALAFALAVRLFQNSVPKVTQCAIGVPSIETLLRYSRKLEDVCNNTLSSVAKVEHVDRFAGMDRQWSSLSSFVATTTDELCNTIIERLTFLDKQLGAASIYLKQQEEGAKGPTVPRRRRRSTSGDSSSDQNNGNNSDQFVVPEPAPGPSDFDSGLVDPMEEGDMNPCSDDSAVDVAANAPSNDVSIKPGSVSHAILKNTNRLELPLFGNTEGLRWTRQGVETVLLTQPSSTEPDS